MKEVSFFKRYWPILVGAVLAITGVVFYFMSAKTDPPDPPERDCYATTDQNLNALFTAGWNVPGDPNYIQTLVFEEDEAGTANAIVVTPWRYNPETKECEKSKQEPMVILPTGQCNLGSWTNSKSYYDIESSDIDPSGRFAYSKMDIIPRASPRDPRMLAFEIDFYSGSTYDKTAVTRPCPPFCPTPD